MSVRTRNISKSFLPYDPGWLPTKPAPTAGESISFDVRGLPPFKDYSSSIKNPTHPRYSSFVTLRQAATHAMQGRAWYHGKVKVDLEIHAPSKSIKKSLSNYHSGVLDTLDGSHGRYFTYLPIIYEDDWSVCGGFHFIEDKDMWYRISVIFL